MAILLAGDVGGTKTILRLVSFSPPVKLQSKSLPVDALYEQTYTSRNFSGLEPIVETFMCEASAALGDVPFPIVACFGIAGPVVDQRSELTNLQWLLDAQALEQTLNISKVALLNDFEANGYGVLGLGETDLRVLQEAEPQLKSPIAVIGAGTGLGEGFLIPTDNCYQVFPGEGGHADIASQSAETFGLFRYLQEREQLSHISVERVVSGIGIVSIYQYLRDEVKFAEESVELKAAFENWERSREMGREATNPAAAISKGVAQQDVLCEKALTIFVELYGAEAGNLALKLLPYGGLYITGGIAAKILPLMEKGDFLRAFLNKGRMQSLLTQIPIYVVLNHKVGLIGAALYAARLGSKAD